MPAIAEFKRVPPFIQNAGWNFKKANATWLQQLSEDEDGEVAVCSIDGQAGLFGNAFVAETKQKALEEESDYTAADIVDTDRKEHLQLLVASRRLWNEAGLSHSCRRLRMHRALGDGEEHAAQHGEHQFLAAHEQDPEIPKSHGSALTEKALNGAIVIEKHS